MFRPTVSRLTVQLSFLCRFDRLWLTFPRREAEAQASVVRPYECTVLNQPTRHTSALTAQSTLRTFIQYPPGLSHLLQKMAGPASSKHDSNY